MSWFYSVQTLQALKALLLVLESLSMREYLFAEGAVADFELALIEMRFVLQSSEFLMTAPELADHLQRLQLPPKPRILGLHAHLSFETVERGAAERHFALVFVAPQTHA